MPVLQCLAGETRFLSAMGHLVKAVYSIKKPGQKKGLALMLDKSGLLKQDGFVFVSVCRLIQCKNYSVQEQ